MVNLIKIRLNFMLIGLFFLSFSTIVNSQSLTEIEVLFKKFENVLYNDFIEAERLAKETVSICEDRENKDYIFYSYVNIIKVLTLRRNYKGARFYIEKALNIESFVTNSSLKIDLYNSIAYIEGVDLDNEKAFIFIERAINLAEKLKDSLRLSRSLINKGGLFIDQQEFDEGKKYFRDAEKIAKQNGYYSILTDAYLSLAESYYHKHNDSALYYYNIALENAVISENKFKQAVINANLGFFNVYNSQLDNVKDLLDKSRMLSEQVDSKVTLHNIYYTYGYYYELLGDYEASIENYKKAILSYGEYVSPIQLSNAYIMLSSSLSHNKDYAEAYNYQYKYIVLNDSIFNDSKAKEFNNIRTKYEVEKKDAAIALLEKENEIEETRKRWLGASAIFLSLALLGVFFFFRQKIKTKNIILLKEEELRNKENERLQKERELTEIKAYINGQEKERNRLAKELHDGVGGKLASINLTLSHINTELKSDAIKAVNKNLSGSFEELRALSHSLSTNAIKDKSFKSLLAELKILYQNSNTFNIEISVFPEDILNNLESKIAHNLYRILQELMNNIVKHAKAKEVLLSFSLQNTILIVIVEDDGCGFDVDISKHGIGIKNIEERIAILDGNLKIDSFKGRGTHVIIELPYKTESING